MFWAGIMGRQLVGPFRDSEGVKMTSEKCCKECLCITGCYGHKRRETHGVAPSSPDLNPIENLWSILKQKRGMRVGGSSHPNSSSGRLF